MKMAKLNVDMQVVQDAKDTGHPDIVGALYAEGTKVISAGGEVSIKGITGTTYTISQQNAWDKWYKANK